MNKYATKLSQKKPADIKRELGRAHLLISLLAIVIIVLLMQGTLIPLQFDLTLATITSVLLVIVVLISLSVSYVFLRTKKK